MPADVDVLGPDPVRTARPGLRHLLAAGAIVLLVMLVADLILGGTVLPALTVVVAAVWAYLVIDAFVDLRSAMSNAGNRQAAVDHVRAERIVPDWVLRGDGGDEILAAETGRGLLMVDGEIHRFAEVAMVRTRGEMIELTLAAHPVPLRSISMPDAVAAEEAALRLLGILGLDAMVVTETTTTSGV